MYWSLMMPFFLLALAQTPRGKETVYSLKTVREAIEKKDVDAALKALSVMHTQKRLAEKDLVRVSDWLSIFLYEDTMATYEKALELSVLKDTTATAEFEKALRKEPNNKRLLQSYITFLINQNKKEEAEVALNDARKKYPYFRVFDLYESFLKGTGAVEPMKCNYAQLSAEEKDFCELLSLRQQSLHGAHKNKNIELAKRLAYPEAQFYLWEMTSNQEYLKKYISKCDGLSDKQRRAYSLVPGVCSKKNEVESLLTETPDGSETE
jgi:predicted Zn-dependent protease